jgi:6-phosphogluconate dehydrogenase
MENKGFTVAVYNRTVEKSTTFWLVVEPAKKFIGAHSIAEFVLLSNVPAR